ncbi:MULTISPECIES: helix-turn-helix domain-containing protein [Chryseobacterium]|uniref:helix-turn-helix domain-containing protein n=1 Tax=Chryseobacterium TaxID=59732 RepID=UPI000C9DFD23|nr:MULTISPECIES: helix-turn-helix domain-containing protein [Chryseobacterium]VXB38295.1 AraC-type DNA-binding protein [Chryseobacterium sp. 8AT]
MQYIVIIGAFQALVALWLLIVKEKKALSNYLFIFLLSAIAVHLTIKFIIFRFIPDESIRQQMNTFISVCYGPLIYLYTLSKTKKEFLLHQKWFIFIPLFVLMIAYFTISCVFIILGKVNHQLLDAYNSFSLALIFIINLYYPIKSILIIRKNSLLIADKSEYDVILRISAFILVMESLVVISKTLLQFYPESIETVNIILRSVSYFILLIICLLIVRKNFSSGLANANETDIQLEINNDSDEKEILINMVDYERKFKNIWIKLDDLVGTKQLFRDCDLTLDQLALKTEINKYQISEMLNNYKNKPFYRYINEYRIEYFKNSVELAIEKNENINFLSFAYDAGFKSKSSFNRYFKEITGKTPSEYYKDLLQKNSIQLAIDQV